MWEGYCSSHPTLCKIANKCISHSFNSKRANVMKLWYIILIDTCNMLTNTSNQHTGQSFEKYQGLHTVLHKLVHLTPPNCACIGLFLSFFTLHTTTAAAACAATHTQREPQSTQHLWSHLPTDTLFWTPSTLVCWDERTTKQFCFPGVTECAPWSLTAQTHSWPTVQSKGEVCGTKEETAEWI